jgi:hypothetical protein
MTKNIVRALEMGAQEYMVKPFLLRRFWRQKSALSWDGRKRMRRLSATSPAFHDADSAVRGKQGHSRENWKSDSRGNPCSALRGGEIVEDDIEKLDRVFDATQGTIFHLLEPIDFSEIANAAVRAPALREKPMGNFPGSRSGSCFSANGILRCCPLPPIPRWSWWKGALSPKKSTPADMSASRIGHGGSHGGQHRAVEAENPQKKAKCRGTGRNTKKFRPRSAIFGCWMKATSMLRAKRYELALAAWTKAAQMDPENKTLQLYLEFYIKRWKKDKIKRVFIFYLYSIKYLSKEIDSNIVLGNALDDWARTESGMRPLEDGKVKTCSHTIRGNLRHADEISICRRACNAGSLGEANGAHRQLLPGA